MSTAKDKEANPEKSGKQHYNAKEYTDAFFYFSEWISTDPDNGNAWEWRGKSFMGMGNRFAEALMDFSYAIELERKKSNNNESSV